jgi:hypothetical protein
MTLSPEQMQARRDACKKLAYEFLEAWFLQHYADPEESCPYESREGGYQWIWGGPYDAEEELSDEWGGVFTEAFLAQVAEDLCEAHNCYAWSGAPDEDTDE